MLWCGQSVIFVFNLNIIIMYYRLMAVVLLIVAIVAVVKYFNKTSLLRAFIIVLELLGCFALFFVINLLLGKFFPLVLHAICLVPFAIYLAYGVKKCDSVEAYYKWLLIRLAIVTVILGLLIFGVTYLIGLL